MRVYKGKSITVCILLILTIISFESSNSLEMNKYPDNPIKQTENDLEDQFGLTPFTEGGNIELLSQIDDNDNNNPVSSTVSGNYLYAAESHSMVIYDISNIQKPLKISEIQLQGTVEEIVIQGVVAHIAADYGGYYSIDVTDPRNPVTLGSYDGTDNSFIGLDVQDDIAYLVDRGYTSDSGLVLLNISNPLNPSFLNEMRFPSNVDSHGDVYVNGSIIFHAKTGPNGLGIYNASDPYNIIEVGSYGSEEYNSISLYEDVLFVSPNSHLDKLFALNVSNLSTPTLLNLNSVPMYNVKDMFVDNNLLFISGNEFRIFNISNPTSPLQLGSYANSASYRYDDIEVKSNIVYLTGTDNQYILNVEDPLTPVLLSQITHEGSSVDVAFYGDYAYSAEMDAGLEIYDISNKSKPVEVGNFSIYEGLNDAQLSQVEVIGDYLFVLESWEGVVIYNLTSDPVHPTEVSRINSSQGFSFIIQGPYMYLIEANIKVYDISSLELPIEVGELDLTTQFYSMQNLVIHENLMIGSQQQTLHFFNLSDPMEPVLITSYEVQFEYNFDFISDFTIFNHFILVGTTRTNSVILDFSDLENIVPATVFSNMVPSVNAFLDDGRLLYIINGTSFIIGYITELGVFGILIEIAIDVQFVHSLTLYNQYAYLSSGVDGTQIYQLPTNLTIPIQEPPVTTITNSTSSSTLASSTSVTTSSSLASSTNEITPSPSVTASNSEITTSSGDHTTTSSSTSGSTGSTRVGIGFAEFLVIIMGTLLSIIAGRRWLILYIRRYY